MRFRSKFVVLTSVVLLFAVLATGSVFARPPVPAASDDFSVTVRISLETPGSVDASTPGVFVISGEGFTGTVVGCSGAVCAGIHRADVEVIQDALIYASGSPSPGRAPLAGFVGGYFNIGGALTGTSAP
jgi:hypothetical protein